MLVRAGDAVLGTHRLEVGDMLLLFTDGLIERADRSAADGLRALVDTVAAARRDAGDDVLDPSTSLPTTAVERVATLVVERMAFFGDGYADDVTVLVAQHRHPVAPLALDLQPTTSVLRTGRTGRAAHALARRAGRPPGRCRRAGVRGGRGAGERGETRLSGAAC